MEHSQDVRIGPRQAPQLNWGREQPISVGGKLRSLFPSFQYSEQFGVYVHLLLRVDGLNVIDTLTDNCTFDPQLAVNPTHIAPPQRKTFADSQAKTHAK